MAQSDLLKSLLNGTAPKNQRILAARGLVPLPPSEMLQLLVILLKDVDQDVAAHAAQTLDIWIDDEILMQLRARDCSTCVLEHFASESTSQSILEAVILNPATPGKAIENLALTVPESLLETILYNRVRILEFPSILGNVKLNPYMTPEVQRLVREIEAEFFGSKRKEYAVEEAAEGSPSEVRSLELEAELPPEDLSLEGLPTNPEERDVALLGRLSKMSVRERIRHAFFGNREIRMMLIRDSNKEVARCVLRSPKLSESEVQTIAAMRGVAEEILREIGNSKEWARSYSVVQNLVTNPKTPPLTSQRMLFRLHSKDLSLLAQNRGIPEAVRHNAMRTLSQRKSARSFQ